MLVLIEILRSKSPTCNTGIFKLIKENIDKQDTAIVTRSAFKNTVSINCMKTLKVDKIPNQYSKNFKYYTSWRDQGKSVIINKV
jgi:hypothetical protein